MPKVKQRNEQHKAIAALHLDLFSQTVIERPAPATLHTLIKQRAYERIDARNESAPLDLLPTIARLYELYDQFNHLYFEGKLPRVTIEYSSRMANAGSYTPSLKLIRMGKKYHELFPEDIADTLKHEMIHVLNPRHDRAFRDEAQRIGTSLKAKYHPDLRKPARYIYSCPLCKREYPRQKRFRMVSCGHCSSNGKYDSRCKLILKSSAHSR